MSPFNYLKKWDFYHQSLKILHNCSSLIRMADIALNKHSCYEEIKLLYMLVLKPSSSKLVKVKNAQAQKGKTFIIMNVT